MPLAGGALSLLPQAGSRIVLRPGRELRESLAERIESRLRCDGPPGGLTMSAGWKLFQGDGQVRDVCFPPPPPWRNLARAAAHRGETYRPTEREVDMVNAALHLRRPLLIEGPPGSGKSSLVYAVQRELKLGPVLHWPINSRSTLRDGLYRYDAVGRMNDKGRQILNTAGEGVVSDEDIGDYLVLGPLGTALVPSDRPRALLIDEIDKSDVDLPNDLLHVLENGWFEIAELVRVAS